MPPMPSGPTRTREPALEGRWLRPWFALRVPLTCSKACNQRADLCQQTETPTPKGRACQSSAQATLSSLLHTTKQQGCDRGTNNQVRKGGVALCPLQPTNKLVHARTCTRAKRGHPAQLRSLTLLPANEGVRVCGPISGPPAEAQGMAPRGCKSPAPFLPALGPRQMLGSAGCWGPVMVLVTSCSQRAQQGGQAMGRCCGSPTLARGMGTWGRWEREDAMHRPTQNTSPGTAPKSLLYSLLHSLVSLRWERMKPSLLPSPSLARLNPLLLLSPSRHSTLAAACHSTTHLSLDGPL